ncbi:hypothetical protein B0H11DRAFT_1998251 [Mycena galericulata]|nr:hypothetical protein B0H11DRAFT_1998251 [Mycena galericulata]
MPTAKPLPPDLRFNKGPKRKRTTTGDDVSTAPGNATSAHATTVLTIRADPFERTIQSLVDRGVSVPPPTALVQMRHMCSEAISSYKSAHVTLQKAVATHEKFAMASSNGTHVSSVVTHLRLPPHQTLTGVPDVMGDERVVAAMASSEKDIASARTSTTTLLTTVYAVQVEKALELVDVPKCADALASALSEYCVRIITRAGDVDTAAWQPCVSAIKAAFTDEFKAVRFEFTARLDKEAMVKEAKANAVITARADAEMTDANRPIDEIIHEKVDVAVTAALNSKETQETEKKKKRPATADNPRSKPKAKSKPQANATASSSKDTSKPLKQTTLSMAKKKDKSAQEHKGKSGKDVDGGTGPKEKAQSGKPNGKVKAKAKAIAKETTEESSDESS